MFEEKIREITKNLLLGNEVDLVIGYKKGSLPYISQPLVITDPGEVNQLIFDRFSRINLAGYLLGFKGKRVAIVAKGCDARSINMLVVEKQIDRKSVYIIGVPCPYMLDKKRLFEILPFPDSISFENDSIYLTGNGKRFEFKLDELIDKTCKRCDHRNPVIYDTFVGEPVEEKAKEYKNLLGEFLELTNERRWEIFRHELKKCIRCYACRQVCPTCYCEECFVDSNKPKWLDKGLQESDILFWHIGRIYHQAGRCVDCGSCSYVCPVGIEFSPYLLYIEHIVKENFNYIPGVKIDEPPPLQTFKKDDPQEFIL